MPPNGVLGLGLVSGGKAFAGDCGLLKAELSEEGKPCILWVWEVAVLPRFKEPMADRGSILRTEKESMTKTVIQRWGSQVNNYISRSTSISFYHLKLLGAQRHNCSFHMKIPVQARLHPDCWYLGHVLSASLLVVAVGLYSLRCCSWQPLSGSSPTAPETHSWKNDAF